MHVPQNFIFVAWFRQIKKQKKKKKKQQQQKTNLISQNQVDFLF